VHVLAVCQPSVPVMAAVARMEAADDPYVPHSMVLMGGPIDTRANPTAVNELAERRGIDWFRRSVITKVPFPNPGLMRDVYPGFLQLNGFVSMNLERHIAAHRSLFTHLVQGDGDSAQKHREFYDEYLAVMDLSAEYYLQTVDTVFVRHALPKGEMTHRGAPVDPACIRRVGLLNHRRRERRHLRPWPDRGGAPALQQYSRRNANPIGCSPASAITACSNGSRFVPRSRRGLRISCCPTTAKMDAAASRRPRMRARRHRNPWRGAHGRCRRIAVCPRREGIDSRRIGEAPIRVRGGCHTRPMCGKGPVRPVLHGFFVDSSLRHPVRCS